MRGFINFVKFSVTLSFWLTLFAGAWFALVVIGG